MPPTPLHPLPTPWCPTPLMPYTLLVPLPLPQEQESSYQEWYYCRWTWHVISMWVRLLFCQMYPHPLIPLKCPQGEASGGKSGMNWGPVYLSSYLIICNRPSCMLLLSVCNWLFSWVCPIYNVPSLVVKSMSAVLWTSANFCNISQNIHYETPLASQHTEQTSVDMQRLFVEASTGKDYYKYRSSLPELRCTPHGTGIYTKVKVDRPILLLIFIFFSLFFVWELLQ